MLLDEIYDINPRVASQEILRVRSSVINDHDYVGFEDTDSKTLYRYYKEGWDQPFYQNLDKMIQYTIEE